MLISKDQKALVSKKRDLEIISSRELILIRIRPRNPEILVPFSVRLKPDQQAGLILTLIPFQAMILLIPVGGKGALSHSTAKRGVRIKEYGFPQQHHQLAPSATRLTSNPHIHQRGNLPRKDLRRGKVHTKRGRI
jgi:hypothetical protein